MANQMIDATHVSTDRRVIMMIHKIPEITGKIG